MSSPFIFEGYGDPSDHTYRVLRRADRELMGYVERDCAREWVIRDLNFDMHDYVEGEGCRTYRTRGWAAEDLQRAFEAGEVAGAKPST